MTNLDELHRNLRWNKLQDVLPPEIGTLKRLTHLWVVFISAEITLSLSLSLLVLNVFVCTCMLEWVWKYLVQISSGLWALIILRVRFRGSLQIYLSFAISTFKKTVSLGEFHQNWALYKTFGTCNILSTVCFTFL